MCQENTSRAVTPPSPASTVVSDLTIQMLQKKLRLNAALREHFPVFCWSILTPGVVASRFCVHSEMLFCIPWLWQVIIWVNNAFLLAKINLTLYINKLFLPEAHCRFSLCSLEMVCEGKSPKSAGPKTLRPARLAPATTCLATFKITFLPCSSARFGPQQGLQSVFHYKVIKVWTWK